MRIVYISAGAGSLRCGACAHDFLMISSLRQLAHEVKVLPVYTPLNTELGELPASSGIFLGGISAYLRVRRPSLARTLKPIRRILDSASVIGFATRKMLQTDAQVLGDITTSFLEGTAGPHAAEIARLVSAVAAHKPDAVILSNSLLVSIASAIRSELGVRVFAGFLGEDTFVMDLPEPHRTTCIQLLREHASALDGVLCPSNAGAQQASLLLLLASEKMIVVPAPVDVKTFAPAESARAASGPPVIGYVSVIRPSKGLDLLLHALQQVGDRHAGPIHVLIAGQVVDRDYFRQMRRFAVRLPSNIRYRFLGEVTLEQKRAMLQMCNLMVMPSRIPEARAMAAMEAMACGVPVIAPAHGVFPELLSDGGWVFEPGSVDALARHVVSVIASKDRGREAGAAALRHIREHHEPLASAGLVEAAIGHAAESA